MVPLALFETEDSVGPSVRVWGGKSSELGKKCVGASFARPFLGGGLLTHSRVER